MLLSAAPAFAGIIITVTPAISPDYVDNAGDVDSMGNPTNPSLTLWQDNALLALQDGLSSYCGFGKQPQDCYIAQSTTTGGMQAVASTADAQTGYTLPSWMGQVITDPASNYINETGNSVRYGVVINGNGTTFTLAQLGFGYTDPYTDPNTGLPYISGGVAAGNYELTGTSYDLTGFVAIDATTGNPTTDPNATLSELFFAGSGFSTDPQPCTDPSGTCSAAEEQAALNGVSAYVGIPSDTVTGTYFLVDPTTGTTVIATDSSDFNIITPEPSTWFLTISAIPAIGAIRRRHRSRS